MIAALVLAGGLSDQIGRRRTLLPSLAFSALSAGVFLLADGLGLLLVGRILSGLSAGILTGTAAAALLDVAPPERRAGGHAGRDRPEHAGARPRPAAGRAALPVRRVAAQAHLLGRPRPLVLAGALVWATPEPRVGSGPVRLRLQRLRVPAELRAVFIPAALAAFAGFAVLGLFTSVAPGFLAQILGIDSRAIVGVVIFVLFLSSMAGQTVLAP